MREVTNNLFQSLMLDVYPRSAAMVDFGIDTPEHYAALQRLVKKHDVSGDALDAVLGSGKKITALVRKYEPTSTIVFWTAWDLIPEGCPYRL